MEKERIILHSDLNNFFASVESLLNPELKGKCVAVCGSKEQRHGIVLAKSEQAKKYGVKTGDIIWQAKQKCRELIIVQPRHDEYMKYSLMVREIYKKYTNQIEPFGIDECWLDVTGSMRLFESGENIADMIREDIKREIGLTVSVGVSFNKVFAKLASDLKKPDATTIITKDNFKSKIWPLNADLLFGVGNSTYKKLNSIGIVTIGDIANAPIEFLSHKFGKIGETLHSYANGLDNDEVCHQDYERVAKSIGHGTTCASDLHTEEQVKSVISYLLQEVSHKLRKCGAKATGIALSIRYPDFETHEFQASLEFATVSMRQMCALAMEIFRKNRKGNLPVRAISVRAINLIYGDYANQLSFFTDTTQIEKEEKVEDTMENINRRFGSGAITYANTMNENQNAEKN